MKLLFLFLKEYVLARQTNRFKSVADVKNYQQKKLQKNLEYIIPLAPFYEKCFENIPFDQWYMLPTMDKTIMMDAFDELNTVGIKKEQAFEIALKGESTRDFSEQLGHITVGLSSGTSGNRGLFIISKEEQVRWAGNILGKMLPTSLFFGKKQKIAFFLRANSNLYNSVNNVKIAFQFFDLLEELEAHIKRLNDYQPTLLIAPASMLVLLARAQKDGRLKIAPIRVVSVAEALNYEDKETISEAFQQIVHQVYQCTEGFLAHTCHKGTLHINEDLVIIEKEYIDKRTGKFVPIITDFSRTSQPIIRYRLNDVLTEGEACTCGSHFMTLKQIDGRCDDLLYGKHFNGDIKIIFADFIRREVMTASDVHFEYKVRQFAFEKLEVAILVDERMRNEVMANIKHHLSQYFEKIHCQTPEIIFVPYIESEKGAKLRRVERCFEVEELQW